MAKPLKILCLGDATAVALQLRAAGHDVTVTQEELSAYDLILGPTCCRFLPGMEAVLPAIIKGARKVKYPKEKG